VADITDRCVWLARGCKDGLCGVAQSACFAGIETIRNSNSVVTVRIPKEGRLSRQPVKGMIPVKEEMESICFFSLNFHQGHDGFAETVLV